MPERCIVEETLGREASLELDTLLADPSRWPSAILDPWKLPAGQLPSTMRQWGAVRLGLEWADARGFKVSKAQMARHYQHHVPILPYSADDIAAAATKPPVNGPAKTDLKPMQFLELYAKGLEVGYDALARIQKRVDELGDDAPTSLLLKLADLGTKLAMSQASIRARGASLNDGEDDDIAGFRSGSAPLPSERMGHQRIRTIDGEARPVRDEGPTDRARYNQRAREEGGPRLPAPS